MKTFITAAFIALFVAAAALPASAGEPQEKKMRKVVKIEKRTSGAWLGVALRDMTKEFSDEMKLSVKDGAFVSEVVDESPADSAGIKENDVIIELNGSPVAAAGDVVKRIGDMKSGETATVGVMRDGEKKSFTVKLGERPAMHQRWEMPMTGMTMPHMRMHDMPLAPMVNRGFGAGVEGMQLMELTDQLGKYFEAPDGKALLVTNVKKNSAARKAGIAAGDVLIKIGSTDIEEMSDLHQALKDAKAGETVDVQLIRKGAHKTVKLEVSKQDGRMMMEFHGALPQPENFHFDHFGFDPEELRGIMKDLKPELDRIKKEVRIRIHDGRVSSHEESEQPEGPGTEL
jgi:C-terminal processing protease CtpA/Prc